MDTHSASRTRDGKTGSSRLTSSLAALVLSLVAGIPLRSAAHFMPHADDQGTPHLGI